MASPTNYRGSKPIDSQKKKKKKPNIEQITESETFKSVNQKSLKAKANLKTK